MLIAFLAYWLWGFVSLVLHLAWRTDAREALREVGVKTPAWWRKDLIQTLSLVDENRARLEGSKSLYRIGLVLTGSVILWVVSGVAFIFVNAVASSLASRK